MIHKTLGAGVLALGITAIAVTVEDRLPCNPVFGLSAQAAELAKATISIPEPPASLSLPEALARAMRESPEVKVAESELARAEAEAASQALWPLRSLSANVSIVRQLNGGGLGLAPGQTPGAVGFGGPTAGAYLTMNVGELIGGAFMMRSAQARIRTSQENVRLVKLQVATGVVEAYSVWSTQKALLALRQDAIKASQSDVVVLERLFGRGGANINDLLKARLAVNQSQLDLLTAEGEYRLAWTTLLQRMGDAAWLEPRAAKVGTSAQAGER